ncbi:hypothetical protein [Dokdonella soli]|uniref:hypothetical protein n=1 Tax=Dokdonella soli TaxID=529810 RepID=UPI0031DBCFAF
MDPVHARIPSTQELADPEALAATVLVRRTVGCRQAFAGCANPIIERLTRSRQPAASINCSRPGPTGSARTRDPAGPVVAELRYDEEIKSWIGSDVHPPLIAIPDPQVATTVLFPAIEIATFVVKVVSDTTPVAPVAPVGPVGPVGPVAPVAPITPVGPVGPTSAPDALGPTAPVTESNQTGLVRAAAPPSPASPAIARFPFASIVNIAVLAALFTTKPPPLGGVTVTFCANASAHASVLAMAAAMTVRRSRDIDMNNSPEEWVRPWHSNVVANRYC